MKNLVSLVMVLAISVVIIGGTLAPYIDGVTAETLTYTNEGMPYAAVDDDTHTIVITSSAITVDGEDIDQSLFPSGFTQYTIVYSDSGLIRLDTSDTRLVSDATISTYSLVDYTVTVTISGTTATITTTDTTATSTTLSNVIYYLSTDGDYVLSLNPYVNSESIMYGGGQTWISTTTGVPIGFNIFAIWNGTESAITGEVVNWSSTTYTDVSLSDVTINTTEIESGLYRMDSVVLDFTATTSSDSYDVSATYTYFLAPAEVVYDNPDYLGASNATLAGVIVLLTIAAMLVLTVRYVSREY